MRRPRSSICSSSASACAVVRGKPSRMKPSRASSCSRRSAAIATIRSSGTRPPASICALAALPSSVPSLTFVRNMSPVEMNGRRKSSRSRSAWVPFPAPGGPIKMRLSSGGMGGDVIGDGAGPSVSGDHAVRAVRSSAAQAPSRAPSQVRTGASRGHCSGLAPRALAGSGRRLHPRMRDSTTRQLAAATATLSAIVSGRSGRSSCSACSDRRRCASAGGRGRAHS